MCGVDGVDGVDGVVVVRLKMVVRTNAVRMDIGVNLVSFPPSAI